MRVFKFEKGVVVVVKCVVEYNISSFFPTDLLLRIIRGHLRGLWTYARAQRQTVGQLEEKPNTFEPKRLHITGCPRSPLET